MNHRFNMQTHIPPTLPTILSLILIAGMSAWAADSPNPRPRIGTTYYVSAASGSDTNTGTKLSAPWRTLQKAASAVMAGDTVYVRGGTNQEEKIRIAQSGTAFAYIKFAPYAGEHVIIDGSLGTAKREGIEIFGNYVELNGFEIINAKAHGIVLWNAH